MKPPTKPIMYRNTTKKKTYVATPYTRIAARLAADAGAIDAG
jgi:hypothetical protein